MLDEKKSHVCNLICPNSSSTWFPLQRLRTRFPGNLGFDSRLWIHSLPYILFVFFGTFGMFHLPSRPLLSLLLRLAQNISVLEKKTHGFDKDKIGTCAISKSDWIQWRSSAPKSGGGGTNFFFQKSKKQKKKKKKGHSGVKAQDRVLWIRGGIFL